MMKREDWNRKSYHNSITVKGKWEIPRNYDFLSTAVKLGTEKTVDNSGNLYKGAYVTGCKSKLKEKEKVTWHFIMRNLRTFSEYL